MCKDWSGSWCGIWLLMMNQCEIFNFIIHTLMSKINFSFMYFLCFKSLHCCTNSVMRFSGSLSQQQQQTSRPSHPLKYINKTHIKILQRQKAFSTFFLDSFYFYVFYTQTSEMIVKINIYYIWQLFWSLKDLESLLRCEDIANKNWRVIFYRYLKINDF